MTDARPRPVLLAILDGLGERNEIVGNAITYKSSGVFWRTELGI
jgi:bisphosphoglycerate-independent phosphoglycerate mutase (AlkP superfamily)